MKTLSLQKLKNKPKIINNILWELTPQMVVESQMTPKMQSLKDIAQFKKRSEEIQGYFFCIGFWEETPHLLLKKQGKAVSEVIGTIGEIPEKMLFDAVEEAGDISPVEREYPVNEEIKNWLKQSIE